jgi:anti-sigma regulatory factor (Ser/Thr protein kinase)
MNTMREDREGKPDATRTAVQESEERLRLATMFPALVLAEVDRELRYVWIRNPHPDFDPAQVLGRTDEELDSSPEIQRLAEMKQEVIETGRALHKEWFIDRSDGRHYYDFHLRPHLDEKGVVTGVLTAALDLTEQKRAEARLEKELQENERLMDALREKDSAIRQAYVDVIDAVTGGKLLFMSPDEIEQALGLPVEDEQQLVPGGLGEAIEWLQTTVPREFPEMSDITPLVDPAGEALTNAVKHAGGGEYQLYRKGDVAQFRVSDHGPGIDFVHLPKATLEAGYSSIGTLGLGFDLMLKRCERVLLSTQPQNTTLVLEVRSVQRSAA